MLQTFDGSTPRVLAGAWAHESAVLIGDVVLEPGVSIWPGAVLRGDMGPIHIGRDSNLQDGTICHDTTGLSRTVVGQRVTVGHRVILHGCVVGDDCLVGMGSILMDNVEIGAGSFVAAGTLLPPGRVVPPGSFVLGYPGRIVRPVSPTEREQIQEGWTTYRKKLDLWLARSPVPP
jgi:carbonic anhydrase/acetyltransferase-like protein (isoleucine patch superfamily)